jgi:lantibiotic biosynthesis protein
MSAVKPPAPKLELAHSQFFVLRTPLLPANELASWSEGLQAAKPSVGESNADAFEKAWRQDVQLLRSRLRQILDRPEIIHALYVASPSLGSGIEHWKRDPDGKKGLQAERALVRYFARMAARPTPFGLFSGCSVGKIDERQDTTNLQLNPQSEYRLCCRLDFDYLFALTEELRRDPRLELELLYFPNTSLHKVAGAWYYTESRMADSKRTHHLVKIESDVYLDAILARAQEGSTVAQLIQTILTTPGEANPSEEEAGEYVLGLIRENEILVSNLSPLLTGTPPLDDLIHHLESLPSGAAPAIALREIRNQLSALESAGLQGASANYEAITAGLEKLPAKVDRSRLYQVDMIKPSEQAILGKSVLDEVKRGVDLLCCLGQASEPEELKTFREAFSARYESSMVPLLDALDEESGVGFGSAISKSDASPLLRGLALRGSSEAEWKNMRLGVHPALLRQVVECIRSGKNELDLDISELENQQASGKKLADAFCVMGALSASSADALRAGDFEFFLQSAFGPSGARLLGRFCYEDPEIDRGVREHLHQEEAHDSEAIYAEIVYLPEGRVGNVLCRPVLREYEIPYLGRSGAPAEKQLPVSDLLLGIESGSIVLYSSRLGKRVIPRLTNAHGFVNPQLSSVYRFLCLLQHQHGTAVPGFHLGILDLFDYLPRIRAGRTIFSLARWKLSEKEVQGISKAEGSARFAAVQKLRQQRGLPRWVVMHEGDNSLPVDLENALSVDAFVHVVKRGTQSILTEMYPPLDRLCVTGPEGSFYHELAIPFVRKPQLQTSKDVSPTFAQKRMPGVESSAIHREIRLLPPGSEWLYAKLYGGAGALDEILITAVRPLTQKLIESGEIDRWFFIRYADPHDHLRVRFHGNPSDLHRAIEPISEHFRPLVASGKLWKFEFDTYQREIERYGGIEGLLAAEELFCADSEAVLDILQELAGDEGLDIRWRTALLGIDQLLSDFAFDERTRREIVEKWRDRLQNEFKVETSGKRQLAERFRKERRKLESLFEDSPSHAREWDFAKQAFRRRSACNVPIVKRLRALEAEGKLLVESRDLVASYSHMHVNRLIRASQVPHELVFYDFLVELYSGSLARMALAEAKS